MKRRSLLTRVAILVVAAAAVHPMAPAGAAPQPAVAVERYYEQPGPHQVTKVRGGPDHTLYYPSDIGSDSSRHPVILWGNGTGATVEQYEVFLKHAASWGFVVAAANTGQSGSGQEILAGGKYLIAEDGRPGSVFQNRIDKANIGAAGHSQGGGGAIAAGADPMVKATLPLQPGPQGSVPALRGPSLFVAGQLDYIVPSFYVRARYSTAQNHPAVFGELRGSDHFFPGETRTRMVGVATAWFRYWLAGDANAKSVFFGPKSSAELFQDSAWSAAARNSKADAV